MKKQELPPIPSKQAEKYLQKLDKNTKIRIRDGILGIPEGDIKPKMAVRASNILISHNSERGRI
ncbi:MAG: hypothetical protein FWD97_02000 [Defluviitaleaceae bacterium]|nr:hypothetical protein [Defluviitaleaceae bacterium]